MKRPERLKLVEKIRTRIHLVGDNRPWPRSLDKELLQQAAECIEQLEKELDEVHINFLKDEA